MDLIQKYFPQLDSRQLFQLEELIRIIPDLNLKVNIISRKDIEHLEERHILHSMSIAKRFSFNPGQTVVDVGTGGGFPGIPLAILFPETQFILVDSIGKKIRLVNEIISSLKLTNVRALNQRAETIGKKADFVVARAVTAFPKLHEWSKTLLKEGGKLKEGGLIALKGGDLEAELSSYGKKVHLFPISEHFEESFFSTKTIVYINN